MKAENTAGAAPQGAEYLTKLTLKGMGCRPGRAAADGKKVALARVFGIATEVKAKEDAKGQIFEAISGTFEGVNLETGESFRSGLLFLPGGLHETVTAQLRQGPAAVKFSLEISAIPASNPIGYSYSAKSLIPDIGQDALADLRQALPAPPKA